MTDLSISIRVITAIPGTLKVVINDEAVYQAACGHDTVQLKIPHDHIRRANTFSLELSGKRSWLDSLPESQLDAAVIENYHIKDLRFDGINIIPLIYRSAQYHHNFNGFESHTVEGFDRDKGYDGVLKFNFTTPFFVWMIEEYPHGTHDWTAI